jgi:hypothetical protein
MRIAFFVFCSVIILFVSCEKKEKANISASNDSRANLEYGSPAEIIEYKNNEQIHITENLDIEKPVVIEIDGEVRFLEFSNSRKVDINDNIARIGIQSIKVYDNASREANYEIISFVLDALLFSLPETEDWLYLYAGIHGFVNVYDLPPNPTTIMWNDENKLLKRLPNSGRYGPLLEIHYNNNIKKFWDYNDEKMGHRKYMLYDYYEGYDEIIIRRTGGWHDETDFIYNMRLDTIYELGGMPLKYNSSRGMAFCIPLDKLPINLFVYRIKDSIYEKITDELLFQGKRNVYVSTLNWINDNEFEIEFLEVEVYEGEVISEIRSTLIGRENGLTFDLIYNILR